MYTGNHRKIYDYDISVNIASATESEFYSDHVDKILYVVCMGAAP
jgi:hypothetical protein